MNKNISILFVVLFITIIFISIDNQYRQQVPEINFIYLDGRQVKLSEHLGKPVLISFWATSCHLCLKEIPELMALYDDMKMTGLEIIGVAMPYDPPNRVLDMSKLMGINYPIALDINAKIMGSMGGVSATPTTFLVSPEGTIIKRYTGLIDMQLLRKQIRELVYSDDPEQSVGRLNTNKPLLSINL